MGITSKKGVPGHMRTAIRDVIAERDEEYRRALGGQCLERNFLELPVIVRRGKRPIDVLGVEMSEGEVISMGLSLRSSYGEEEQDKIFVLAEARVGEKLRQAKPKLYEKLYWEAEKELKKKYVGHSQEEIASLASAMVDEKLRQVDPKLYIKLYYKAKKDAQKKLARYHKKLDNTYLSAYSKRWSIPKKKLVEYEKKKTFELHFPDKTQPVIVRAGKRFFFFPLPSSLSLEQFLDYLVKDRGLKRAVGVDVYGKPVEIRFHNDTALESHMRLNELLLEARIRLTNRALGSPKLTRLEDELRREAIGRQTRRVSTRTQNLLKKARSFARRIRG